MSGRGYLMEEYGHLLETSDAAAEELTLDATEALCEMMEKANVSRAELAKKMEVSKAYITQLLSGSRNMTLRTFATAAYHCGQKVKIDYQSRQGRQKEQRTFKDIQGLMRFLQSWTNYQVHSEVFKQGVQRLEWKGFDPRFLRKREEQKYSQVEVVEPASKEEFEECYAAAS